MDIIFNGLNINDKTNYFVEKSNHDDVAKQEIDIQKLARTNTSLLLRKSYGERTIKMEVIIKDTSKTALDTRLDTFRWKMEEINKNLDIDYAGGTRRYVSSGSIKSVERKYFWAKATVEFKCYQAFGEETANTTEEFLNNTTTPYTNDVEIAGTAPAQPDIQIDVDSITSSGDKFMQFKNTVNGNYVKITADDWAISDVIIISTRLATVTKNGTVIEYLGIMPAFLPGDNNWEYTDDFTARQVDITISYKKRYL